MVLGVGKQTMNYAVLGELEDYHCLVLLNIDLLKYWLKIQDKNNPNTQLQQFYNQQYEDNIPLNNKKIGPSMLNEQYMKLNTI